MRCFLPVLIAFLLCGCGRETHVRNKVYSVLPQMQMEMGENGREPTFAPELLNPWVNALGTDKVVTCLVVAVEEMSQNRRAALWMLKAYAPEEKWREIADCYPELYADLPSVDGYGWHGEIAQGTAPEPPPTAAGQRP